KGPEAGYILHRTRAGLLLTDHGFLGNPYVDMLAGEEVPHLSTVVTFNEPATGAVGWDGFLAGATPESPPVTVAPEDLCDIFFTSGTTGRPKGAMLTHGQSTALYVSWSELANLRAGDRYLLVNPFFNTFGYKPGIVACLLRGATIVPQPVFDVET